MTAVLITDELGKRFGAFTAVDGITLSVEKGEAFGLLGPNGAGKTTTIKMLTTLLPPTSGSATVAGFDIVKQSALVRYRIGYVPQLLSADGGLTGYENLLMFAKLYDIPFRERNERIRQVLELMGLSDSAHRMVKDFSGGMIRRLEIAQEILHRPVVLFLDEPTVGLDPATRHTVWKQIELLKDSGTTIFITTHYMDEAERLCDRIAIMNKGKIAALGTPEELKALSGAETLDQVFEYYAGGQSESEGSHYDETSRTRQRLG